MKICSKHKFFSQKQNDSSSQMVIDQAQNIEEDAIKQNTYNMLLTFLKELIGKSEEFQDELLVSTMYLLLHVPIEILYQPKEKNLSQQMQSENIQLWKSVMIKALELGHLNNRLAMTCIKMLEKWFNTLPVDVTAELYTDILPKLSDFLAIESAQSEESKKNGEQHYYFTGLIQDDKKNPISRQDIANKVLDLLGKIGGHAHQIINNELAKKHDKENFIRWDPEKRLQFALPLHNKKVDIYLDSCLPRIVDLAQNSSDKETRIAACELLHALIIFMIGKSATKPTGKGNAAKKAEDMAAFAKLYAKLFPVIIRLATEIEQISRQLFEPLCFQIVRWFSSSKIYEHAEVESLLDSLIEGAQSRNNSTLREMCSNAVAEFARWSLKQMTEDEIRQNPVNIKSLIRRIESNSNHPDPFKRLSSVLCFTKIFQVIQTHESLMDTFCLEIARCVLSSLKMCHNSLEFQQEVIENCSILLQTIKVQIIKHSKTLMKPNPQRSVHQSLDQFIDFLFSKFIAVETIFRQESHQLWQSLVTKLPTVKKTTQIANAQQLAMRTWIKEHYVPEPEEKSIFWNFRKINFQRLKEHKQSNKGSDQHELRKTYLLQTQKQLDQFTAYLEFVYWMLTEANFSFHDLGDKLRIDLSVIAENITVLLEQLIEPKFEDVVAKCQNSIQKLLACKEDKEQMTKSKMRMLSQMFQLLTCLDKNKNLEEFLSMSNIGQNQADEPMSSATLRERLQDLALQICLVPAAHQLQLLVQDPQLEKKLRSECENFIKRSFKEIKGQQMSIAENSEPEESILTKIIQERIVSKLKIASLDQLTVETSSMYHPRILDQLCNGYFRLVQIDKDLHQKFSSLAKNGIMSAVVEKWVTSTVPSDIEQSRILVNFMCKLKVPNEVLFSWLTNQAIYQKTSDYLLVYIAENWSRQNLFVGEYLIQKAGRNMELLGVLIPIVQYVSENTPGYSKVLLHAIPENWHAGNRAVEYAENQVKIFSLIVSKCAWALEDASDQYARRFVNYLCNQMIQFLHENALTVYSKKQVLHLIGLMTQLRLPAGEKSIFDRLKTSLKDLQQSYFPISTRELQKQSNEAINFEKLFEGFLDLVDFSKSPQLLSLLYRFLRENKPEFFHGRLTATVNNIVKTKINPQDTFEKFFEIFKQFLDEFCDQGTDESVDDNLRWAIASKIVNKILETCPLNYLVKLMISLFRNPMQEILEQPLHGNLKQIYLRVREKTHVMIMLEIIIRRIDAQVLRTEINNDPDLYGKDGKGTEILLYLIKKAQNAAMEPISGLSDKSQAHMVETQLPELNSVMQVQRRFACAAYNLLSCVIFKTQMKEKLYANYLFTPSQTIGESVWHRIVDTSSEQVYEFKVETNFNIVDLKDSRSQLEASKDSKNQQDGRLRSDLAKARANNLLNEYVTTSFMSANEKFNSAMVFETQMDEDGLQKEKKQISDLIQKKIAATQRQIESQKDFRIGEELAVVDEEEICEGLGNSTLELDEVNKHECMKNIKRTFDRMKELFVSDWNQDLQSVPAFMEILIKDISDEDIHLNIKIFILKLAVNNRELFKPYARHWFRPICTFIASKQTGGKGFHYFLRDLTILLLSWSDAYTPKEGDVSSEILCSKVVNTLIKCAPDKSKMIFNTNIDIIRQLMQRWRHVLIIQKEVLLQMLIVPDAKDGSHLWKMTGIQILALSTVFDVSIMFTDELQKKRMAGAKVAGQFTLELQKEDKLLQGLLSLQELTKKQLIYASSECLGMILQRVPAAFSKALPQLMLNENKENRHDIFVNAIERITRWFPGLLAERKILMKLLSFVNSFTGTMRSVIFKSFDRYLAICDSPDLVEISRSLESVYNDILGDISDENQQNFLILVTSIIKQQKDVGVKLLDKVAPRLKSLFADNKNDLSRALYYDLMIYLFEEFDQYKSIAKSALIRGLADQSQEIKEKIVNYWNRPEKLGENPYQRIQKLIEELYDPDEEPIWLNNAVFLLLQVAESSDDFNRAIFSEPLSNCKFDSLYINQFANTGHRSMPITPSLANMSKQIIAASQAQLSMPGGPARKKPIEEQKKGLAAIQEQDENSDAEDAQVKVNQIIDTRQTEKKTQQLHLARQSSQVYGSQSSEGKGFSGISQGFLKATQQMQQPVVFPSQILMPSSLVANRFMEESQQPLTGIISAATNREQSALRSQSQSILGEPVKNKTKLGFAILRPTDQEDQDVTGTQNMHNESIASQFAGMSSAVPSQKQRERSKFMHAHDFTYKPVVQDGPDQMIRYIPNGSMPAQIARKDEKRRQLHNQLIQKSEYLMEKAVPLYRQYRVGELPDIQISFKDVLLPMMALVRKDSTIATELMVEVFTQIYKSLTSLEQRQRLGDGIHQMLKASTKFDHGAVNCIQRIAIELLKVDGFTMDANVVAHAGKNSMSFQTSLILLEETILNGIELGATKVAAQKSKRAKVKEETREAQTLTNKFQFGNITQTTKEYWFNLIQIYDQIGNEDALHGIWISMIQTGSVMLKSQDLNAPKSPDFSHAISLISQAQVLKAKGSIAEGLKELEQALNTPELNEQFEQQVFLELQNKKYDSMASLLKWDSIVTESLQQTKGKQLNNIPNLQAETQIRAQLRMDSQWALLSRQMKKWQDDPVSKAFLDRKYNFEQAFVFITEHDFDRARFYINKEANDLLSQWKDLTKLSQVSQHLLVQKVQKIYEMKEFLSTVKLEALKSQEDIIPQVLQQMVNWTERQPSFSFDKLGVWDDILVSRELYLLKYKKLFKNDYGFDDQLAGRKPCVIDSANIADLQTTLYSQTAKGAFKMGMFDTCEKYLKKGLDNRGQNARGNLRIIIPIIKLKTQQLKKETIGADIQQKFNQVKKILNVLNTKMKEKSSLDVQLQVEACSLQQVLHKKLLTLSINDLSQTLANNPQAHQEQNNLLNNVENSLAMCFSTHQTLADMTSQIQKTNDHAKVLFRFSQLTDKICRKLEESENTNEQLNECLNESLQCVPDSSYDQLAASTVKNALMSINLGYLKASDILPRLLHVVSQAKSPQVEMEFKTNSESTPCWVFLRWIGQLVAVINRQESSIITKKVTQIAKKYPHALFYPFKVVESNILVNIHENEIQTTKLFEKVRQYFNERFENLNQWTEALECLIHPEQRMLYWLEIFFDIQKQQQGTLKKDQTQLHNKLNNLLNKMKQDVANVKKPLIGSQIGSYNQVFAQSWNKYFNEIKIYQLPLEELNKVCTEIKQVMQKKALSDGHEKVEKFCEWLHNLDNNDFYNSEVFIEIPGQYENTYSAEPVPGKNVKIASIRKTLLTLGSQRRPKRITVHGSNEKDYHLLIKGGEDLRLDQRVQQLFQIMNSIFKEDPQCLNRDLNLKTFRVVPITNRLGSLEWVDNTEPLKVLINREHQRLERKGLEASRALQAQKNWLKSIKGNEKVHDLGYQHIAALRLDSETVSKSFTQVKSLMNWSLLRNGLQNLCLTSSAFITIKNQFIKSIGVFSVASYLMGIGDRHLENFLVDITDGEVLGIDFGFAFGSGVHLPIPELVPFRLTQQIEGVIAPHSLEGTYKKTMVITLSALVKRKSLLLDACEIFVKEPLLDWVKQAKDKLIAFNLAQKSVDIQDEQEQLEFYPRHKIKTVKDKLNGVHPIKILWDELKESTHQGRGYYNQLCHTIKGGEGSFRRQTLQKNMTELDIEDQIDCLVEMARDPDMLGRAWVGWDAFI